MADRLPFIMLPTQADGCVCLWSLNLSEGRTLRVTRKLKAMIPAPSRYTNAVYCPPGTCSQVSRPDSLSACFLSLYVYALPCAAEATHGYACFTPSACSTRQRIPPHMLLHMYSSLCPCTDDGRTWSCAHQGSRAVAVGCLHPGVTIYDTGNLNSQQTPAAVMQLQVGHHHAGYQQLVHHIPHQADTPLIITGNNLPASISANVRQCC